MTRFLWGMALGAAVVAYAVVAAGGRPAWLFGAGVVAGALVSISIRGRSSDARGEGVPSPGAPAGALCPGTPAEPESVGAGHPVKQGSGHHRRVQHTNVWSATSGQQKRRSKSVDSVLMLSTVQQEVLSGLMNLGAPFREAEAAVRAARDGHAGQGFDELFRRALAFLKPAGQQKAKAA